MSRCTEQDTLFSDDTVITDGDSTADLDYSMEIPDESLVIQVYRHSSPPLDNGIQFTDDSNDNDEELLISHFSKVNYISNLKLMISIYNHESSSKFQRVKKILAVICACMKPPSVLFIATTLEIAVGELVDMTKINGDLYGVMTLIDNPNVIILLDISHNNFLSSI
jgi:hypothetical protein